MNTSEVKKKQSHLGKFVVWESDCHGDLVCPRRILVKEKISLLRNKPNKVLQDFAEKFWYNRTKPRWTYLSVYSRGKTQGPKVEVFRVKREVKYYPEGGFSSLMSIQTVRPPLTQKELRRRAAAFMMSAKREENNGN